MLGDSIRNRLGTVWVKDRRDRCPTGPKRPGEAEANRARSVDSEREWGD